MESSFTDDSLSDMSFAQDGTSGDAILRDVPSLPRRAEENETI